MSRNILSAEFFGGLTLRWDGQEISDTDSRSKKVWTLLAYLIYHRNRTLTPNELTRMLWGEEGSTNPQNALKTTLHRARAYLESLYPGAGRELIIRKGGSYAWNTEIPMACDLDEFESLCRQAEAQPDPDLKVALQSAALSCYQGDLLPGLSSESWVMPVAAYYHNQYVKLVLATLPELQRLSRYAEIISLCDTAITVEPYNEEVYFHLMQAYMSLNENQKAIHTYNEMRNLLYHTFGTMPGEDCRALFRKASRTVNPGLTSPEALMEQLQEDEDANGALVCDFDFFRVLCQSQARSISRSGHAAHLCLLTLHPQGSAPLSKRSLGISMDHFQDVARSGLRRGDAVSRYNSSQFLLLLPQANYEDSCMVCQRLCRSYSRQFPHAPVKIQSEIIPLAPSS